MLRVLISPKYFWAYLYAQIKWLSFLVGRPGIRTNRPLGLFLTLTKCFVFQIIRPHPGLCSKHSIIFPFTAFLYLSWLPQFVATLPTVVCNIRVKHELNWKQPLGCSAPPLQGCPSEPEVADRSSVDLRGSVPRFGSAVSIHWLFLGGSGAWDRGTILR